MSLDLRPHFSIFRAAALAEKAAGFLHGLQIPQAVAA